MYTYFRYREVLALFNSSWIIFKLKRYYPFLIHLVKLFKLKGAKITPIIKKKRERERSGVIPLGSFRLGSSDFFCRGLKLQGVDSIPPHGPFRVKVLRDLFTYPARLPFCCRSTIHRSRKVVNSQKHMFNDSQRKCPPL